MVTKFNVDQERGASARDFPADLQWPNDPAQIPDWVYTDERVYKLEQERIFQGATWTYVAIDAELPNPGDYIRSFIGDVPIIVARDENGDVHAFENRCAHRGAEICKVYHGNTKRFICPYHQWTYALDGSLVGVPFRKGVKGKGGMPEDFSTEENGLRALNVVARNGVIFASFCHDMPHIDDWLGPHLAEELDTIFKGRKVKLLGHHRNTLAGNWKLYQENLKDPYHATLLHTYLTTFGLFVAGNRTEIKIDDEGKHSTLLNAKPKTQIAENDETKADIRSYRANMKLADPRILDFVEEFDSPYSSSAITIWPNLILLRQMNILGTRHIVPQGPNQFILIWTALGYEDDTEEMTRHRLRQNNIFGPGGFLGIDDHEALKFVQDGVMRSVPRTGIAALGADEEPADTVITDRAIRAMYKHYRRSLGI